MLALVVADDAQMDGAFRANVTARVPHADVIVCGLGILFLYVIRVSCVRTIGTICTSDLCNCDDLKLLLLLLLLYIILLLLPRCYTVDMK